MPVPILVPHAAIDVVIPRRCCTWLFVYERAGPSLEAAATDCDALIVHIEAFTHATNPKHEKQPS
jgi:hypothetical protein